MTRKPGLGTCGEIPLRGEPLGFRVWGLGFRALSDHSVFVVLCGLSALKLGLRIWVERPPGNQL